MLHTKYVTVLKYKISLSNRNYILKSFIVSSFHSSQKQLNQQDTQQEHQNVSTTPEQPNMTPQIKQRPSKEYSTPIGRGIQKIGKITAYFSKNFYALGLALIVLLFTYIYNNAFFPTQEDTKEEKRVMSERALNEPLFF